MDMWTVRRAAKRAACRGQRYNRCPPRHPLTTNPQTPKTKIFFLERGSKAKPVRSSPQRLRRALCTHCSGRPARTSRIHVPEFSRCPCQHFSKPANNPVSFLIGECRCISHQPFTATQQNVLFGETRTGTHRLCLFSEHAGHVFAKLVTACYEFQRSAGFEATSGDEQGHERLGNLNLIHVRHVRSSAGGQHDSKKLRPRRSDQQSPA